MKVQYRIACSDTGDQAGDVYDRVEDLLDAYPLVTGLHNGAHEHRVEARLVGPWEHVEREADIICRVFEEER